MNTGLWLAAAFMLTAVTPACADALRPAIGAPLQQAERDLAAHQYAAASRLVAKAQAVPGKTASETLTIAQVRAAVDAASDNYAAAAADDAALIATGALPPDQVSLLAQAQASSQYQARDYAGAIATIKAYLPHDARYRPILLQSYEQLGQCGPLSQDVMRAATPAENELDMVAYCDATAKDTGGYLAVSEALVKFYPSPGHWSALLAQLQVQPRFSDRLALDFFRLKLAAGVAATAPEYMEFTQEAVQAGLTNEASKIIAQGYAAGVLGSGPDAGRQTRLKTLVATRQTAAAAGAAAQTAQAQAAKDQATLFALGFNQVDGGNPAGLTPMETAIRSGALTQPAQAELELGIAYREAGDIAKAKAMWTGVQGGADAELAGLWADLK